MTTIPSNAKITKIEQYALDSNVFHNWGFINSLRDIKTRFHFVLPTIVTLEVGFYFRIKGISWDDFIGEIQKFGGSCLDWDTIVIPDLITNAVTNKNTLPFRTHFRDILIGSQCEKILAHLITENKRHFAWCNAITVLTPDEFSRSL